MKEIFQDTKNKIHRRTEFSLNKVWLYSPTKYDKIDFNNFPST